MTGRDLIIYILQNNLEDKKIYEDGKILGFMTADEIAAKLGVGTATVMAYNSVGIIPGFKIGETTLIPANVSIDVILNRLMTDEEDRKKDYE